MAYCINKGTSSLVHARNLCSAMVWMATSTTLVEKKYITLIVMPSRSTCPERRKVWPTREENQADCKVGSIDNMVKIKLLTAEWDEGMPPDLITSFQLKPSPDKADAKGLASWARVLAAAAETNTCSWFQSAIIQLTRIQRAPHCIRLSCAFYQKQSHEYHFSFCSKVTKPRRGHTSLALCIPKRVMF